MVKTELRPSTIHGIGAFLLEDVKASQLIWRFDSRIDRVFADAELNDMSDELREFLTVYSTYHEPTGLWVLCGDNGRHFNHSDKPNTISMGAAFGDDVAAGDLRAGTELTTDYNVICDAIRTRGAPYLRNGNGGARPLTLS